MAVVTEGVGLDQITLDHMKVERSSYVQWDVSLRWRLNSVQEKTMATKKTTGNAKMEAVEDAVCTLNELIDQQSDLWAEMESAQDQLKDALAEIGVPWDAAQKMSPELRCEIPLPPLEVPDDFVGKVKDYLSRKKA
jgi:hypothetical protein